MFAYRQTVYFSKYWVVSLSERFTGQFQSQDCSLVAATTKVVYKMTTPFEQAASDEKHVLNKTLVEEVAHSEKDHLKGKKWKDFDIQSSALRSSFV